MSYAIIIRGPLGCGKTTIAKKLAEKIPARYFSIDEILHAHGLDKVDDPDAETIPVENFIKANEAVIPEAKNILANGTAVIFDGNFQHKQALEHLVQQLSYPTYVFTLKAPLEVCIERDRKRAQSYGEDSVRALYDMVSRFEYGTNIEVNKSIGEVISEMHSYLPKS